MKVASSAEPWIRHSDRIFVSGKWIKPSTDAVIEVLDSDTEERFLTVAEAKDGDIARAVGAAREAFDEGPWPTLSPSERAVYLRAIAAGLRERAADLAQASPRETGTLFSGAHFVPGVCASAFEYYADLAESFPFEEVHEASMAGGPGVLVREPVGVVGAIVPWNAPLFLATYKLAPALLAGCTVVLKAPPEAPVEAYVLAEIAESVGLPAGVLNMVAADRQVSELLVRDPRVDKISFTGSTAAGRRIAAICGERVARCSLELGGKSAAVVLDDYDIETAATTLSAAECTLAGQVCGSLTRIVVSRDRHDQMAEALASTFSKVRVGDPFSPDTQMGPLVSRRQQDRVEGYIAKGLAEGATLLTGGGRPGHLDRGYYVEPTVFAHVDNSSTIGQEEIFGPVLSVIAADDEEHAVKVANDSIYGLKACVFTNDIDRARNIARRLRCGTVARNAPGSSFGIASGGFKQSGLGREGGVEGLRPYLETKSIMLNDT